MPLPPPSVEAWPLPRYLSVATPHRVAYRVVGNPAGEPWLLLHGGPGGSGKPGMLRPLDLAKQWAIVPDQRGAGASTPTGRTVRNTTAALVADLESLRQSLGIERWNVVAGSWGTVVALAYVARHPTHVGRMVLRGAFAARRRELAGLLQPRGRVAQVAGSEVFWPRAPADGVPAVLAALRPLLQAGTPSVPSLRVVRQWNLLEMACGLLGLRRSLRHATANGEVLLARRIRRDVAGLQRQMRRTKARRQQPQNRAADKRLRTKFRVQAHYLTQRGFVRPGALDRAVRTAADAGVAIDWVHGRFDAVCPSANSLAWAAMAPDGPGASRLHLTRSGHFGTEADTLDVLRKIVRRAGKGLS